MGIAISPDNAGSIAEGTETYALKFNIDNAKTVGPGCTGCATGVCTLLNSVNVIQAAGTPGGDQFIGSQASRN